VKVSGGALILALVLTVVLVTPLAHGSPVDPSQSVFRRPAGTSLYLGRVMSPSPGRQRPRTDKGCFVKRAFVPSMLPAAALGTRGEVARQ